MITSLSTDMTRLRRALGDPTRGRIVELLAGHQMCTCQLVDALSTGQTNVSNHLRVLREAGVVDTEPFGRFTYYRLVPEAFESLAGYYASLAVRSRGAEPLPCC